MENAGIQVRLGLRRFAEAIMCCVMGSVSGVKIYLLGTWSAGVHV
jgi:hypothetical protein